MQDHPQSRRLTRSADHKLGGVCGGIAEYFGVDATLVRLGFVVLALFSMGLGALLVYGVLWAIMPAADASAPAPTSGEAPNRSLLVGIVLIVFGVALLFQRIPVFWWLHWGLGGLGGLGWPLLLLAAGVLIVIAARRR